MRNWLVKFLLSKVFPKMVGGPWSWLAMFFGKRIFDNYIKPSWFWLLRKGYALTRKWKRKAKAERLENADNETDFDDSFDDMP